MSASPLDGGRNGGGSQQQHCTPTTKQNKTKAPALEELYISSLPLSGSLPDAVPPEARLRLLFAIRAERAAGAPALTGRVFVGCV